MADVVRGLGALAGLLAILGLGVLSVVYVAHARDVERLRDWAGRAPERSTPGRRSPRRIGLRSIAIACAGLLLVGGAAAYGVTHLGDDAPPSITKPKRQPTPIKPGDVTVAVLNGTTVPGLAAALRDKVAAAGFRAGAIDVSGDQQLAASVVQYAPGHLAEAKVVGRRFAIDRFAPASADTLTRAEDAPVILIIGADKTS